jgi:hypothetical protein
MNQDEHHVLTPMETILARKKWKDVDRSYGNSWSFKKTSLNPIWKENTTLPFQIHLILGQNVMNFS